MRSHQCAGTTATWDGERGAHSSECRTSSSAGRSHGFFASIARSNDAVAGLATDGLTPEAIKRASLYRKGDVTPHGQNLKVSTRGRAGRSGGLTK